MKIPKCKMTVTGKHIWDSVIRIHTGEEKERIVDTSMIGDPPRYEKEMYWVTIEVNKCIACGSVDDRKLKKDKE